MSYARMEAGVVRGISRSTACHVTEFCLILPLAPPPLPSSLSSPPPVEWSMSKDFSPLAGEIIMDNLQTLRCTITGLTTVSVPLMELTSSAFSPGCR